MHKYEWNNRSLTVRFNSSTASADHGESSSDNGPAEWDRGCEDAKGGSYDRSRHSDAYEEGCRTVISNRAAQSADGGGARGHDGAVP
jgi:hypothetical protein